MADDAPTAADAEAHFRCKIAMGMKYDIWVTSEALRFKQGMRKAAIQLADVTWFGVKRRPDEVAGLTELRLVTPKKVFKLPFNPDDSEAKRLLARLIELRPDADVSKRMWSEAAPLLGVKPFGLAQTLLHPWVGAGLALFFLSPIAVWILNQIAPTPGDTEGLTRTIALVICMVGGVVITVLGVLKVRKARAAEAEAAARRDAASGA